MPAPQHPSANNAGYATIEVLISILILSIGIISTMKLQISAIQMTQQSNFFSTAQFLSNEMAEKMRGNREQLRNRNTSPYLHVDFQSNKQQIKHPTSCFTAQCDSAGLADSDITEWLNKISMALPNAHAKICLDDSPWDDANGRFRWDCSATHAGSPISIKLGWGEKGKSLDEPAPLITLPVNSWSD